MTDMIQDLRDELDDLRSTGEVEAVEDAHSTGEMPAVEERLDDLRSTGEMPAVQEPSNEPDVKEAPVVSIETSKKEKTPIVKSDPIAETKPAPDIDKKPAEKKPTPAPIVEKKVDAKPVPVVETQPEEKVVPVAVTEEKPEPVAISNNEDAYNPSFALKIFMILRHGFIVVFDIVLTGIAIVVEGIAALNWAGYGEAVMGAFQAVHHAIKNRIPQKYRITIYALIAILIVGLPAGWGAFSLFSSNNVGNQTANSQTVTVNQQNAAIADNGILAPLFTPTVQLWAEDIAFWTANSAITPDMLATVMQLESCGNVNVQGGLFGVGDDSTTFNAPDIQANIAVERLENALSSSDGDFGLAMAIYSGGESILQSDFVTWSQHNRDMFILGRTILHHTEIGMIDSPDLNSWLQNTGAVLCSEAQSANNQ